MGADYFAPTSVAGQLAELDEAEAREAAEWAEAAYTEVFMGGEADGRSRLIPVPVGLLSEAQALFGRCRSLVEAKAIFLAEAGVPDAARDFREVFLPRIEAVMARLAELADTARGRRNERATGVAAPGQETQGDDHGDSQAGESRITH